METELDLFSWCVKCVLKLSVEANTFKRLALLKLLCQPWTKQNGVHDSWLLVVNSNYVTN